MPTLKIEFENQTALMHFSKWLCEQGEQDYWIWMEYREAEEDGPITVKEFIYNHPQHKQFEINDPRRYEGSKFINDNTIKSVCGRRNE